MTPPLAFLLSLVAVVFPVAAGAAEPGLAVVDGRLVTLEYVVTDEKGETLDSSEGTRKPIVYVQGQGGVFPALQQAILGLSVGDEKEVRLEPKEAFGEVNPDAYVEVPKEKIPEEGRKVGTVLTGESAEGRKMPVRVHEVKDDVIVLDTNHPLAGKTIVFHVKVSKIEKVTPPEESEADGE